jgi:hypothetical protein
VPCGSPPSYRADPSRCNSNEFDSLAAVAAGNAFRHFLLRLRLESRPHDRLPFLERASRPARGQPLTKGVRARLSQIAVTRPDRAPTQRSPVVEIERDNPPIVAAELKNWRTATRTARFARRFVDVTKR